MSTELSIIIPHFNRAELLHSTLASIVESISGPNVEVIVVDDGSDPLQWQTAQQFDTSVVRFLQRTDGEKGPSRCRNIGLQASTGDNVVFIDSDDLVAPWMVEQRLRIQDEAEDADFIVFPVMLFAESPGDQNLLWNDLSRPNDLDDFLRANPPWHTSSPIWRRDALLQIGGFNEAVMYGDDSDLHIRGLLQGLRYRKYDQTTPDVFVRRGDTERITTNESTRIIESRRTRLIEGSKVINAQPDKGLSEVWEGQYFFEAEFLLFNCKDSLRHQKEVVADWITQHHPSVLKRLTVRIYLAIARMTINRAYFLLRLARRATMMLLPASYVAKPGGFESTCLSPEQFDALRQRLKSVQKSARSSV